MSWNKAFEPIVLSYSGPCSRSVAEDDRTDRVWLLCAVRIGHPLKGPLSREKPIPCKEDIVSLQRSRRVPYTARICLLLTFAESSALGVDDSSPHRSPIRFKAQPLGVGPLPPSADQKIFGSMPCPHLWGSVLMAPSQPVAGSRHGRQRVRHSRMVWGKRLPNQF